MHTCWYDRVSCSGPAFLLRKMRKSYSKCIWLLHIFYSNFLFPVKLKFLKIKSHYFKNIYLCLEVLVKCRRNRTIGRHKVLDREGKLRLTKLVKRWNLQDLWNWEPSEKGGRLQKTCTLWQVSCRRDIGLFLKLHQCELGR